MSEGDFSSIHIIHNMLDAWFYGFVPCFYLRFFFLVLDTQGNMPLGLGMMVNLLLHRSDQRRNQSFLEMQIFDIVYVAGWENSVIPQVISFPSGGRIIVSSGGSVFLQNHSPMSAPEGCEVVVPVGGVTEFHISADDIDT
ncbi:hypothetical protein F2Q70_00023762 [Brassica cretica]|uniref:Uncharacterized protein n=1 Tax=Brassica cretica TaxID=69181 RepID=A0A8S9GL86_BRACR|nr:hypothetical protein F2Q70_00023762 [Brassica cretica]